MALYKYRQQLAGATTSVPSDEGPDSGGSRLTRARTVGGADEGPDSGGSVDEGEIGQLDADGRKEGDCPLLLCHTNQLQFRV